VIKSYNYIFVAILFLVSIPCFSEDWPQYRGPNRDGISLEKGLLKAWPVGGPKLLWTVSENLGEGYSSAAIADGLVFVTGMIENNGVLFAFDVDGNLKWNKTYGPEWTKAWPGTRSTPTIIGSNVYVFSGNGQIFCYDSKSGKLIWTRDIVKDYDGIQTEWGWSESLLIVDEKVICTPGGKTTTMVALDKSTGEVIWDKPYLGEQHAFCSPILVERGGKKIIINRTEHFLFGVNADDGEILWSYNCKDFMKPAKPPQIHPNLAIYQEGNVYITSGYDAGGAMFTIPNDGNSIQLKWTDKTLDVFHGGVVLVGDYIYGSNYTRNRKSEWYSLEWKTGRQQYKADWNRNQGSVIYADERLYCYDEKIGELALVEVGPEFKIISSFKIPKSRAQFFWAHPSISDSKLYVRNGENLFCYDIKE